MDALWQLCYYVRIDEVRAVLARGGDVNDKDSKFGATALMWAVLRRHNPISKLLHPGLNSANSTNNNGETALMVAVSERKKEVLLELVQHESVSLDLSEGDFIGR